MGLIVLSFLQSRHRQYAAVDTEKQTPAAAKDFPQSAKGELPNTPDRPRRTAPLQLRTWHDAGNAWLSAPTADELAPRGRTAMSLLRNERGFTIVDVAVVLFLLGVALSLTAPISRRIVARYELNTAAHTLSSDLAYAKMRAIQSNSITVLRRETERQYRVDGRPRQLPSMVRFAEASVDSLGFNGLGSTVDRGPLLLVLENRFGERIEVRIYSSGGYQVRRL